MGYDGSVTVRTFGLPVDKSRAYTASIVAASYPSRPAGGCFDEAASSGHLVVCGQQSAWRLCDRVANQVSGTSFGMAAFSAAGPRRRMSQPAIRFEDFCRSSSGGAA